jgi:hypothetical protein
MKNDKGFFEIINHRRDKFRPDETAKKFTYGDLLAYLKTLNEDQLKQTVQILSPNPNADKPTLLEPGISINTVRYYCYDEEKCRVLTKTRSADDFEERLEQIVILRDGPPFDIHGNSWFTLEAGGKMRGNKTGKLYSMGKEEADE